MKARRSSGLEDRSGDDRRRSLESVKGPDNGRRTAGTFLAVAFSLLILMMLRRPDAFLNPQFWAEDGVVYFSQALVSGPSSIFSPYARFLWILPRMVSLAVTLLPVLWAPFVFNLVATVINATCCALFSLPGYRHLVRSDRLRIGSCILFATALSAGGGLTANLTNMPHYLALAAVGAMVLRPDSVGEWHGRGVAWLSVGLFLCATSSPDVIVVAPLALWQAYKAIGKRNWKMCGVSAALLAGISIQGMVAFAFRETNSPAVHWFPNVPMSLLFLGVLRCLLGEGIAKALAAHFMLPVATAASISLLIWGTSLWKRLNTSFLLVAALLFAGPVFMAAFGRHVAWANWTEILSWGGERYFLLPGCAFIVAVAAWLDTFPKIQDSLLAMPLLFVLGIAGNFRVPPDQNFDWPTEAAQVRQWLATGHGALLTIPPGPPWVIQLPNRTS